MELTWANFVLDISVFVGSFRWGVSGIDDDAYQSGNQKLVLRKTSRE